MPHLSSPVEPLLHRFTSAAVFTAAQATATASALVVGALWAASLGDGPDPGSFPVAGGEASAAAHVQPVEPGPPLVESPPQETIFIVGSESEAQSLSLLLAQDAAIRSAQGLAPVRDEVVVATSAEEAERLEAAIDEGNRILASQNMPEVRRVNLRSPQ